MLKEIILFGFLERLQIVIELYSYIGIELSILSNSEHEEKIVVIESVKVEPSIEYYKHCLRPNLT